MEDLNLDELLEVKATLLGSVIMLQDQLIKTNDALVKCNENIWRLEDIELRKMNLFEQMNIAHSKEK